MAFVTYVVVFAIIAAASIAILAAVLRRFWPESPGYRRVGVTVGILAALYAFWLLTAFGV